MKGREVWSWSGEGYKRPGGKAKSKKLFFKTIQRGRDSITVNDCAVFLSTGRSDRPYIGNNNNNIRKINNNNNREGGDALGNGPGLHDVQG